MANLNRYLSWRTSQLRDEDGVMAGADLNQEWLLPWWWEHYQKHNSHPVIFIDFGMSFEAKDWCKKRGELFSLRMFADFIKERENIDPAIANHFEEECGTYFWDCRNAWFKKPFACLQTPFRRTLWIDVDCEIRGPMKDLFPYADPAPGVAMVQDQAPSTTGYPIYNSGVMAFHRHAPLIDSWARHCIEYNHILRGDQEIFSYMVHKETLSITEIPPKYNWSRFNEKEDGAIILHWHGPHGKTVIRSQINMKALSEVTPP